MNKNVLVIGGGLAGSLISNELSRTHAVTLLEAGPRDNIVYPELDFSDKKLAEVETFCYGGGGTTNLWHNGLIPISEQDVTNPVFRELVQEAEGYIDRAASRLYFKPASFVSEYRQMRHEVNQLVEHLEPFSGHVDTLVYPRTFEKLSVTDAVHACYRVDSIDFDISDGRINRVGFSAAGTARTIEPDIVIIAAGAIGSPRLVSKVLEQNGMRLSSPGKGFMDHPIGFVGKVKLPPDLAEIFSRLSIYDKGDFIGRSAIRLKSNCGQYTCAVFFRPAMTMDNRLDIYKYKSLIGASKGLERFRNLLSSRLLHPDIIAEIVSHLFSVKIPGRIFNVFFVGEQKRGGYGVSYDNGRISIEWGVSDTELRIYRDILTGLRRRLDGLAEEVNIKTDLTADWLWSCAHHSGTLSLGDDENDLLDRNLKLRNCENLYVCDGSVIQEHSYANTGLTIGQLALRLCDRLSGLN